MKSLIGLFFVLGLVGCASQQPATEVERYRICKTNPNSNYTDEQGRVAYCADDLQIRQK